MEKVYFRLSDADCILDVNNEGFMNAFDGWVLADEGGGDRYRLAQCNYLPGPIRTGEGIPRYRWNGHEVVERTQEEIAADQTTSPPPVSETDQLRADLLATQDALASVYEMLMGGV